MFVSGSLATRNYDGKDGKKVYITEVKGVLVCPIARPRREKPADAAPPAPGKRPSQNQGVNDDIPF